MESKKKAKVIAFYLPQYHLIPENNEWWGKGFTEWTNVAKAKKLFKSHYQPHIPADLGFYDLRVPETRKAQADMANEFGVEGFCYWHYWFGNGKRLLERPFNEVLYSKEPNFPFCLAWANETWKGFAHGLKNRNTLIEQLYDGKEDYIAHFNEVLPAFLDDRYIKIDEKPMFMIYKPLQHPDLQMFMELWHDLAKKNGMPGIYFVGHTSFPNEVDILLSKGLDSVNVNRIFYKFQTNLRARIKNKLRKIVSGMPQVFNYADVYPSFVGEESKKENVHPTICPNWDHSPRSGKEGVVFHNSTPELFEKNIEAALKNVEHKTNKIIFLKSWNEWAEGNYMEPDQKWGSKYLEVLKKKIL
nr:glycoside hydrolase family 99-like domain-containing protein [uncultured Flavobacterium sp.]